MGFKESKWTGVEQKQLIRLFEGGKTDKEVSRVLKRSYPSVRYMKQKLKICELNDKKILGDQTERNSVQLIESNGFRILEKPLVRSCFDILAEKAGKIYAIDVKYRSTYFTLDFSKIEKLSQFGIPVLLFWHNDHWYWSEWKEAM